MHALVKAFLGLAGLGLGVAVLGGDDKPREGVRRGVARKVGYTPPVLMTEAPPPGQDASPNPPRIPLPDYDWREVSGEIDVASMARTPRFPPALPGYVNVTLAELVPQGTRVPLTVFCDVLVTDATVPYGERGTSMASVVDVITRTHLHTLDTSELHAGPTVHGERLVREFRPIAGQLVGDAEYNTMRPLPHNDPEPPSMLQRFIGPECTDAADPPQGWRAALAAIGFDQAPAPPVLFHVTKCDPEGPAYERVGDLTRYYNLNVEGRGSGVVLTARIARLPAVQRLTWRAVYAVLRGS